MRCTIITDSDHPDELRTVDAWFETWRAEIMFIGENEGCGCCVNIWQVEASAQAFAALPATLRSECPS